MRSTEEEGALISNHGGGAVYYCPEDHDLRTVDSYHGFGPNRFSIDRYGVAWTLTEIGFNYICFRNDSAALATR
jgi:hypothetical protein